jgi:hypothetical protein
MDKSTVNAQKMHRKCTDNLQIIKTKYDNFPGMVIHKPVHRQD